jgi:hypothetical protein
VGIEKIISLGVMLVFVAAATGQLPKAIRAVHVAQLKLLKESQASKWPKAALLN